MADEVFIRAATQLAGAFSADMGRLSFGGGISVALVQNVNATYMQNVVRLYEIGANANKKANVYYVGGRTQGQLAIARVVGPSVLLAAYYRKFGDVCQAKTNTIALFFDPLDCDGGRAVYTCNYCVLTQIGISVAAQDMVVNENSQLMFSGMTYEEGTPPAQQTAAAAAFNAGAVAPEQIPAPQDSNAGGALNFNNQQVTPPPPPRQPPGGSGTGGGFVAARVAAFVAAFDSLQLGGTQADAQNAAAEAALSLGVTLTLLDRGHIAESAASALRSLSSPSGSPAPSRAALAARAAIFEGALNSAYTQFEAGSDAESVRRRIAVLFTLTETEVNQIIDFVFNS